MSVAAFKYNFGWRRTILELLPVLVLREMGWFGTEDLGSSLKMLPLCDLPTVPAENWQLLLGSCLA